ncbi:MAG: MFS transporter [Planctomycetota bacterium]
MKTQWKLGLLASLYFSQGLPFGFFSALPAILREQGFTLASIGHFSLLSLPWAFKFLWAPLVDRYGSRQFGDRRVWIIPLQLLAVTLLFSLSGFDLVDALPVLVVGVLAANLFAATQDIATDALAVDLLSYRERGLGNGVQVAGYRVGMIVGGGPLVLALTAWGWPWTFQIMAVFLAVASLPICFYREPPRERAHKAERISEVALDFLTRPRIWAWLIPLMLYKAGDAMGTAMLKPLLIDVGVSVAENAKMVSIVGYAAGLLGALAGGFGASRLGRRRAVLLFGFFQSLTVSLYILPAVWLAWDLPLTTGRWVLLYLFCGVEHFAGGTATVALFTLMMDYCRPKTAATDYTLQASLVVIATLFAGTISGEVADRIGYMNLFALSGFSSLLGVFAVQWSLTFAPADEPRELQDKVAVI